MIAFIMAGFTALSSVSALAGYAEQLGAAITLWYVQRQQAAQLSLIADAAAFAAQAKTDADRYTAAAKWQAALANGRISS